MEQVKLKAIKKGKTLVEKVVDQIQTLIAAGELNPGDVLPVEFKLAKTLNIGKSTMREALKILETKGIVEVVPRKGVFVRQRQDPETGISMTLKLHPRYHLDLLESSRMYISGLAILACKKRTDSHLKRFKHILRDLKAEVDLITENRSSSEVYEQYGILFVEFFSLLGEATCNPVCEEMMNTMLDIQAQQLPLSDVILTEEPDMVRMTFELSRELVSWIEKRDAIMAHKTALKATHRLLEIVSAALSL